MEGVEDLYGILGVSEDATDEQIRKAYKKLAVELHPDRFVGQPEAQQEASARFSKVSYAHNILKDKQQRADYDFERQLHMSSDGVPLEAAMSVAQEEVDETKKNLAEKKYNQGLNLIKSDQRRAMDAFKEAIKLNPNNAQYHTMLGITYQKLGWPTYALSELKSALKLVPRDPLASKWLRQVEAELRAAEEREEAKKNKGKKGKKGKKEKKVKAKKGAGNKFRKKKVSFWRWLLTPFLGPAK